MLREAGLTLFLFLISVVYGQEVSLKYIQQLQDLNVTVGQTAYFFAVLRAPSSDNGTWYRNGIQRQPEAFRIIISSPNNIRQLALYDTTLADAGTYTLSVDNVNTSGILTVTGASITTGLQNREVQQGDTIQLDVELSQSNFPISNIKWEFFRRTLTDNAKYQRTVIGRIHRLTINDVQPEDAGEYTFTVGTEFSSMLLRVTQTDVNECTTGTDNCSQFATCENRVPGFICRCFSGYSGNGVTCSDINECASINTNNCSPNAACSNTPGSFTCRCNSGFSGNGVTCVSTGDVDECQTGANNCNANAVCTNTIGSFTCACGPGWIGNGVTCIDVDECQTGANNCNANAVCTNTIGSFTCACGPGWIGNGVTCIDVDECQTGANNCNANAVCTNTIGSFTCACGPGWIGNGVTCIDVNECNIGGSCSPLATCVNTQGSYQCTCISGYSGNGRTCVDVNECNLGTSNCSPNAQCTNTNGSFTCRCNSGFNGDGVRCVRIGDVDECQTGADNCNVNAVCTNTIGSFFCACRPGWVGDGVTCTDVDECQTGADNCNVNAVCTNTIGSFFCACRPGWVGDGVTCIDVNECSAGTSNCNVNAQCTNNRGSFTCTCNQGFIGDGFTCNRPSGVAIILEMKNVSSTVGSYATLSLRLTQVDDTGVWYKDDVPVTNTSNRVTYFSGQYHYLTVFNAAASDAGRYSFQVAGLTTVGYMTVTGTGVNGGFGAWTSWANLDCSVTCGTGTGNFRRSRACDTPRPSNGGLNCTGDYEQFRRLPCTRSPCSALAIIVDLTPRAPQLGASAVFTAQLNQDNVQNGVWLRNNVRLLNSTKTIITVNGRTQQLVVTDVQAADAGTYTYTVNGLTSTSTLTVQGVTGWGQWTAWDPACPATCGGPSTPQFRTRTCVNRPLTCNGETFETRSICNPNPCPVVVDGEWSGWSVVSNPPCDITCGSRTDVFQERRRTCTNPAPSNGGRFCPGSDTDRPQKICEFIPCPVATQDLCSNAQRNNGVGFRYHPTDCDKYIQCFYNPNGNVLGVYWSCPFGFYWDQRTFRCAEPWKVTCPVERCSDKCNNNYGMSGSCRAYWQCNKGGVSVPKCCMSGFMYEEGQGCRPNFFCRDTCPTACANRDVCNKRPDWSGDVATYNVSVGLLGWLGTRCVAGSYFDATDCGCSPLNSSCTAFLRILFNSDVFLRNARALWLRDENVTYTNGIATFRSDSYFFANVTKSTSTPNSPIIIKFRYRETTTVLGRRVLISTSDCRKGNSLVIAIDNDFITFEVTSWYGNPVKLPISTAGYSRSAWKTVTFLYNGYEMIASIEGGRAKYSARVLASDSSIMECGILVGTDGMMNTPKFIGEMDELTVYKCDPGNVI